MTVFYIGFRETKPPFDDPQVRRAFGAAFDRDKFVAEVMEGQGVPMIHFAPPGVFGAPAIDQVGTGFDPEFAREQLAAAGYPDCEGFPQVTLAGFAGQRTSEWMAYAQAQWAEHLNCDSERIQIVQQPLRELLATTAANVADAEAPHMWTLGWAPDYPDENNWVGDVLWCANSENRQKRVCNEIDDLIVQARAENDPQTRIDLYRQVEEMFFGADGELPFFPIYVRSTFVGEHSWLDHQFAPFGGQQYYNVTIDAAAQAAAQ